MAENILKFKQFIFSLVLAVALFAQNILITFLFVDSSSSVAIFAQPSYNTKQNKIKQQQTFDHPQFSFY